MSNFFSDIIDVMYELDETYLKRLFIKALELKTEQTVCMDLKEHAVIAPKNPREVEANKKIKKETNIRLNDAVDMVSKMEQLGELQRAVVALSMYYDCKIPFTQKTYEVNIVQKEISPKEYIQNHFPTITFEDAYREYMSIKSDMQKEKQLKEV